MDGMAAVERITGIPASNGTVKFHPSPPYATDTQRDSKCPCRAAAPPHTIRASPIPGCKPAPSGVVPLPIFSCAMWTLPRVFNWQRLEHLKKYRSHSERGFLGFRETLARSRFKPVTEPRGLVRRSLGEGGSQTQKDL